MLQPRAHLVLEGAIIATYLVLMLVVGFVFERFNKDTNDYFRGGCRATWWLVGTSAFMTGFSAWTFTGAAGAIYGHGWSILCIYWGNAFGFLLNFLFFGPWARQLRTVTGPEALKLRFGDSTRAFYALVGVIMSLLYSGLQLYGLALYSSSVFGLPLHPLILGLGAVVVLYSTVGGSWAVMATDFLQGLILIPITLALATLCLIKLGGVSGLLGSIQSHGLSADYSLIPQPSAAGSFTQGWFIAVFAQAALGYNNLGSANRYFSVKDGRAARKAALLGCALFLFGAVFWFIPPMTARILFSDKVAAMPYGKPEETAYAVASLSLLPPALVGVMVVATFAATMSAMGPGLNGNAGVVVYDMIPLWCKLTKRTVPDLRRLMATSRVATVVLGALVVTVALSFAGASAVGLFDAMINIGAMLAVPLAVPLLWCLFVRHSPAWAGLFTAAATFAVSATGYFLHWSFPERVGANVLAGSVLYLGTVLFWSGSSAGYREQARLFFERMHTPIDFEREVGSANDERQLRFIGVFGMTIAGLVLGLALLPNDALARETIVAVGGAILVLSGGMYWAGRTKGER